MSAIEQPQPLWNLELADGRTIPALELARRVIFIAETAAREIEAEHPELAPIGRAWLVGRIVDELSQEAPH